MSKDPWEKRSFIDTVRVMFGGYAKPYVAPIVAGLVLGVIGMLAIVANW